MDKSSICRILRIKGNDAVYTDDEVVTEFDLNIRLNGKPFVSLLCTPEHIEELVIGHLYSEGIIRSLSDIQGITLDSSSRTADVRLDNDVDFTRGSDAAEAVRTLTTACGKQHSVAYKIFPDAGLRRLEDNVKFKSADILEKTVSFNKESELFLKTGGVHSAALYDLKSELFFAEDIGRHNAFDKIIGFALKSGMDFIDKLVFTSGRIPSDMVLKAVNAMIPVLVSRSAPTKDAIAIAEKYDLTLIGFARANRMNVYAGMHRVEV